MGQGSGGCVVSEKRTFILAGAVFGRLTVLRRAPNAGRAVQWVCRCECGGEPIVRARLLVTGKTQSCGCLRKETTSQARRSHGMSESRTYRIWHHMKRRCTDEKHPKWLHYGGRGITLYQEWHSFERFLEDMGEAPAGASIDRINNELGYWPGNCQWATQAQQTRNTRRTRRVEIDGETLCVMDWCARLGVVNAALAYSRINRGWDALKAVTTPVEARRP